MKILINPGTEEHTPNYHEAHKAAKLFLSDLGLKGFKIDYLAREHRGYHDFLFSKGKFELEVSFPSFDPEVTRKGIPFESARIYVDGSSWLWDFGLGIFEKKYKDYLLDQDK